MDILYDRFSENRVKYQCYRTFIEESLFLGYVQEGRAFLFRGDSDGPWVYFVCETLEEFMTLLPHLRPEDKQFGLVEDYMIPYLATRGQVEGDMRCMRFYLPDEVPLSMNILDGVQVRPLVLSDVPFMYDNYIYKQTASVSYFEGRIKAAASFGVEIDGGLVGWVMTHDDGSLGMMHVLEAYRGRGIAELLTIQLCLSMRAKGVLPHLGIKVENVASAALARKIGFVEDRIIHWLQLTT